MYEYKQPAKTPLALAIGTAVTLGLASAQGATAQENPFSLSELSRGYMVVAAEGKCGEGKCGGEMKKEEAKPTTGKEAEGKCGEGKCGGEMKKDEAKPATDKEGGAK